jgi:hypothetical protein
MIVYRRRHDGAMMISIRTEHRMDLRSLTLALYHSNETLGEELSVRAIRTAVTDSMADSGDNLINKVSDYLREEREYAEGSAVGSDVNARLEWARRMVVKAYGREFEQHPESLADLRAFEALPVGDIT